MTKRGRYMKTTSKKYLFFVLFLPYLSLDLDLELERDRLRLRRTKKKKLVCFLAPQHADGIFVLLSEKKTEKNEND